MTPSCQLDSTPDDVPETTNPFRNAVGAFWYLVTNTRPDLSFAVSCVARYMHKPSNEHWDAVKYILRYLSVSKDHGISLGGTKLNMTAYADASHATVLVDCHSVLGHIVFLGAGPIIWQSIKSKSVHLSSSEAEALLSW
mmetsp:Transcript_17711/g.23341  ORF Transcript_17711/g.23341 Transcript_17711/m.23341 type:complete len:139 (-) Transcript_17711:467-883(-)